MSGRTRRAEVVLLLAIGLIGGCRLLVDLDGLAGGTEEPDAAASEAGRDATPDADEEDGSVGVDASTTDAPLDVVDASDPDALPTRITFASCKNTDGGSVMVDAGGYCIDALEVTQAQYKAFLDSAPKTSRQIAECQWNASFTPTLSFNPAAFATRPVVGVDWCDAYAYCAWVGKRLCGKADGGAIPPAQKSDPASAQWYASCSNGGTRAYPYGSYEAGVCNNADLEAGAAVPVGSLAGCQGGVPGAYDMSGNVAEWIDSCLEQPDAMSAVCSRRGGDFNNAAANSSCLYDSPSTRNNRDDDTGIRCCAD